MPPRRWLSCFLGCAFFGTLLDQLHTQLGVLSYANPVWFGQAWWVAPNFGFGGVVLMAIALLIVRRDEHAVPSPTSADLLNASVIFGGSYLMSCFSYGHNWLMLIGFVSFWCWRLRKSSGRRPIMLFSLIVATIGPGYELMLTSTGIYFFHEPDLLTVPAWLPGLYLNGAPLGLMLAKRLR